MKSSPFDYLRPATLTEAIAALSRASGTAVALAGGQSLMPLLALRIAPADLIVDIGRLPELTASSDNAGRVRLGAGLTHAMIEDGKVPDPTMTARGSLMRRVAANIAYRAVRNHGTVGGSLALADPAADWPAVLLALDAAITITGPSATRTQSVDDFLQGAYATTLQPGEIITSLDIPRLTDTARTGYVKVVRKSGAFASAICCIVYPDDGRPPRAVLAGTTTRAHLLPALAAHLGRQHPDLSPPALKPHIAADIATVAPDADAYQHRLYAATIQRAIAEATA